MAASDFLNANERRSYPFVDSDAGLALPVSTIVDFGCMMGLDANFDDATDSVYLYRVSRVGSVFTFEFRSTSFAGQSLTFTRNLTDAEFTHEWASVDAAVVGACPDALWEGFLITGMLDDLANIVLDGGSITDGSAETTIEPGLVHSLASSFVRSVNLANRSRTVAWNDACGFPEPAPSILVNKDCIGGDLQFKEGFNATVRQCNADRSLTIGAAVGAGAGESCEEVKLVDSEVSPDGGSLLTGGPACDEVVQTINGVPGPHFVIYAGLGVSVTPGPGSNEITITIDNTKFPV